MKHIYKMEYYMEYMHPFLKTFFAITFIEVMSQTLQYFSNEVQTPH